MKSIDEKNVVSENVENIDEIDNNILDDDNNSKVKHKVNYNDVMENLAYSISNWYLYILVSFIFAPIMFVISIVMLCKYVKKYNIIKRQLKNM